jgi:hypothetical protein
LIDRLKTPNYTVFKAIFLAQRQVKALIFKEKSPKILLINQGLS